jgi:pheromone shutdown protein TraB
MTATRRIRVQRIKQARPFVFARMITLLGVGHVFDIGSAVRAEIVGRRPNVVALELDPGRYQALMSRQPRPHGFSVLGLLAQFQVRIANQYGVQVGEEMVAAARAAREIGAEIALIDQDSGAILRRVWREMSGRERFRLLFSTVGGLFTRRERVEAELQRFYQDEQGFIREFARELPTAKRILIDERDAGMAATLRQLAEARGDVVAVVGEGHVTGLLGQLAGTPVEVVHLEQLRSRPAATNASVNVSVQL